MLDIEEINNTIQELENANTTFDTCLKLASLYIVKANYKKPENRANISNDKVEKELSDILPAYRMYCEVKRKYKLNELTENAVNLAIQDLCKEIIELIATIYAGTDSPIERNALKSMLSTLFNKYSTNNG